MCRRQNRQRSAVLHAQRTARCHAVSSSRRRPPRLQCVDWSDASEARQAAELMQQWAPIGVADALELLSPDFVNEEVQTWWKLLHLCRCLAAVLAASECAHAAQLPCMAAIIRKTASVRSQNGRQPSTLRAPTAHRCGATLWRCCRRRTTRSCSTTCCSWCRCAPLVPNMLRLRSLGCKCMIQCAVMGRARPWLQPCPAPLQALRYEAADDSRLAAFLVARGRRSLTVASFLFWCGQRDLSWGPALIGRLLGCHDGSLIEPRTPGSTKRICLLSALCTQLPFRYLLTELGDDSFGPRAAVVQSAIIGATGGQQASPTEECIHQQVGRQLP